MSLNNIDKTRAIRTDDELRELVEAIYSSPPNTQETHWLEWKSSLDLGSREGQFTVAKAILGFANRSVKQAKLACEGVAYMVVGVEPGNPVGVGEFDHAALGQALKRYVNGPRWTLHRVEFSSVTVLVVMVEPPRPGDTIHTLQKEFSNDKTRHYAGAVFHRGTAHTEPAGPKEVEMLCDRLLSGSRPDLVLDLQASAEPLMRLRLDEDQVEDWLRRHEAFVRANSGQPRPPPPTAPPRESGLPQFAGISSYIERAGIGSIGSVFARDMYAKPEDAEEFERRVKEYLAQLRRSLLVGHLFRRIVRSDDDNKVYFTVGNETDDSVSGVQLTVVVPGNGLRVFTLPPSVDRLPPLPKWPDSIHDRLDTVPPESVLPQQHYDFDPTAGSVTDAGEAFEITWDVGDLRPGEWSNTRQITIVADPSAPDEVEIELIARAMSHRRITTSKTTLAIASDQWTLDDWLNAEPRRKRES